MKRKLTAYEAILYTVEARILMAEGKGKYKSLRIVYNGHGYREEWGFDCPLCEFCAQECNRCPIKILTGVICEIHDKDYHEDKPMEGLSFALALQYYWEKRHPNIKGK